MRPRTLLTAALVAGVMACSSDPIGPADDGSGFNYRDVKPNPDQVTITGQVELQDGRVSLHAFEDQWAGQVLSLAGTLADELRDREGAIVRVTGTVLGDVLRIDSFDMIPY